MFWREDTDFTGARVFRVFLRFSVCVCIVLGKIYFE